MLAMNFNRGRSHLLGRIASEPDQKSLIRHETVCACRLGARAAIPAVFLMHRQSIFSSVSLDQYSSPNLLGHVR
jgi:hypothetical protein